MLRGHGGGAPRRNDEAAARRGHRVVSVRSRSTQIGHTAEPRPHRLQRIDAPRRARPVSGNAPGRNRGVACHFSSPRLTAPQFFSESAHEHPQKGLQCSSAPAPGQSSSGAHRRTVPPAARRGVCSSSWSSGYTRRQRSPGAVSRRACRGRIRALPRHTRSEQTGAAKAADTPPSRSSGPIIGCTSE
jgi:hypothetical protein